MDDIWQKFASAIVMTGDPLAPIKLKDAYNSIECLGPMMAAISDRAKVEKYKTQLLSGFPDDMDNIAGSPDFICALSGMLAEALIFYAKSL